VADRIPLLDVGKLRARVEELRARKGAPPWSDTLVMTDDIQAFIICHLPGHPNDTHYHLHDEWWIVLQGEIDWYIEGEPGPLHARAGDFVLGPKNRWHHLEPVGLGADHPRRHQRARRVPPLRPSGLQTPGLGRLASRRSSLGR